MKKKMLRAGLFFLVFSLLLSVTPVLAKIVVDEEGHPLPPGTYNLTGVLDSIDWGERNCMISDSSYTFSSDAQLYLPGNVETDASAFTQGTEVRFYRYHGKIISMWKLEDADPSLEKNTQTGSDEKQSSAIENGDDTLILKDGVWHN